MYAQLTSARAAMAKAQGKLSADQDSQTAAAPPSVGTGRTTPTAIAAQQRKLLADQHRADLALAQTRAAVAHAAAVCRPAGGQPTPHPSSSPKIASPSPSASPPAGGSGGDVCAAAQGVALGWETTSYQDEHAVAADVQELTRLLSESAPSDAGQPAATPVSADQLVADQAAVDAADAAEQAAQQDLDQAKLLSPAAAGWRR